MSDLKSFLLSDVVQLVRTSVCGKGKTVSWDRLSQSVSCSRSSGSWPRRPVGMFVVKFRLSERFGDLWTRNRLLCSRTSLLKHAGAWAAAVLQRWSGPRGLSHSCGAQYSSTWCYTEPQRLFTREVYYKMQDLSTNYHGEDQYGSFTWKRSFPSLKKCSRDKCFRNSITGGVYKEKKLQKRRSAFVPFVCFGLEM